MGFKSIFIFWIFIMAQYVPGVGFIPAGTPQFMNPNLIPTQPPWSGIAVSADQVYQTYQNLPAGSIVIDLPFGRGGVDLNQVRKVATQNGLSPACARALLRMVQIQSAAQSPENLVNGESAESFITPTASGQYKPMKGMSALLRNPNNLKMVESQFAKLEALYAEYRAIWFWMSQHCIVIKLGVRNQRIEMPHERLKRK